jgi:transglutaminase-like putative cysteine protease
MVSAPRRQVGCALVFEFLEPSVLALQIAPSEVISEQITVIGAPEPRIVNAAHGGRAHIVTADGGEVSIRYSANCVAAPPAPAAFFDDDVLSMLRQSRYCPSDVVGEYAIAEFGAARNADDLVDVIASWVFERITYESGVSGPTDSAVDTLLAGRGVCRDFAHLVITFCRALNIPARMVSVYAPGLMQMDFHAVAEVWRHDRWEVVDATRLAPRSSLVRIATGRDAADTAFAATISGDVELVSAEVFAVVDGDLPTDDHVTVAVLGIAGT